MRAVTRLGQGVISATNPARPRLAPGRFARSMAGLYVPRDQLGSATVETAHVENLAYGSIGSNHNGRFTRRWANPGSVWPVPRIRSDIYGPYWDFNDTPNWNFMLAGTTTQHIPWRPGDNGGYQAGTLMVVLRHTAAPSGDQTYFGFGGSTPFTISATGGNLYGFIRMGGGSSLSVTGSAPTVGDPYAVFFTTRSTTDHEFVMVNLRSGAISTTTSTTNLGTAGTYANTCAIGSYLYDVTSAAEYARAVRIYQCGLWLRGMSLAEMGQIAKQVFALATPSVSRIPNIYVTPEVEADLAVTEAADTLVSSVIVPVVAAVSATEADDTLASSVTLAVTAAVEATDASDILASTVQVGPGVIGALGDLAISEEADTLAAKVELDTYGDLAATEMADSLAAFAAVGSNGPFTRRPFLNLN
jgi:hypothetical protein